MKTKIAILAMSLMGLAAPALEANARSAAAGSTSGVNLKITGGPEDDVFEIRVSEDGRTYEIKSNVLLEADSSICWQGESSSDFLLQCRAMAIAGFEISGGAGSDTINLFHVPVPATILGGSGADSINGGSGADLIQGGPGRDLIHGGGGDDLIRGEEGNDSLIGNPGNDKLEGEAGDDFIIGSGGNDSLRGGTGSDKLSGSAGADILQGGPGDDLLVGGAGFDVLAGGPGHNTLHQ